MLRMLECAWAGSQQCWAFMQLESNFDSVVNNCVTCFWIQSTSWWRWQLYRRRKLLLSHPRVSELDVILPLRKDPISFLLLPVGACNGVTSLHYSSRFAVTNAVVANFEACRCSAAKAGHLLVYAILLSIFICLRCYSTVRTINKYRMDCYHAVTVIGYVNSLLCWARWRIHVSV